jgi:hypothetical protein
MSMVLLLEKISASFSVAQQARHTRQMPTRRFSQFCRSCRAGTLQTADIRWCIFREGFVVKIFLHQRVRRSNIIATSVPICGAIQVALSPKNSMVSERIGSMAMTLFLIFQQIKVFNPCSSVLLQAILRVLSGFIPHSTTT